MGQQPIIVLFRTDLRTKDHAALFAAASQGAPVVPLYVLDDSAPEEWSPGRASRWWLHHSLSRLNESLTRLGSPLVLRRGITEHVVAALAKEANAGAVYWSRSYEPWARKLEGRLNSVLTEIGVEAKRFRGALLHDPERLTTLAGTPFKVYTPFWRALSKEIDPFDPRPAPASLIPPQLTPVSDPLASWRLLPTKPDWSAGLGAAWTPGESGAEKRLTRFLGEALAGYGEDRNRPDKEGTSRLSPHLHFGEISPRQCWDAASRFAPKNPTEAQSREVFLKELCWREFSAHLLFHVPTLPDAPFRPEFAHFPWHDDAKMLRAWQQGNTGYPIVDAGMRELWVTGYMHNRVRMIAASFLIKHLLLPWQRGEAWFWDTLVDADLASNAASWQWVAGSGADAAPYFRIFNPVMQGQKFDPLGTYVRRWVPEIARLPTRYLHAPWMAPPLDLASADVILGQTYPHPMVDHAAAREVALDAFNNLKQRAALD